jgi:hypothetical protein
MNSTVPQLSIINKLNFGGLEPSVGTKMECVFLREGEQTQPDGTTKINIEKEGKYLQLNNVYTLDNNVYTNSDDFDKTKFNELFGLKINEQIKCVSFCVISLLIEVINNDYTNWNVINLL